MIDNLLGIKEQVELMKVEEKLSKIRAREMYDLNLISHFEVGTFQGLEEIHSYLFQDIHHYAGELRSVNIKKVTLTLPLLFIYNLL